MQAMYGNACVTKTMVNDWCRQLHNNACRHILNTMKTKVQHMHWEALGHMAYSPALYHCNFHIFGPLKQALKGHQFQSNVHVKQAVHYFLQQQPLEFFKKGIQCLVTQ
jgi:hypothetical protein